MLAQDCAHRVLRGGEVQKQRPPRHGGNQNRRLYKQQLDLVECHLAFVAPADLCILSQELEDRLADSSEMCYESTNIL